MAAYTTIDDTEAYFQVKLYTGNAEDDSSTTQDITLDGDTDMQPDLVWIKDRTDANNHQVADAVMGANIQLSPDITNAQRTSSEYLKSFASDGFQLGGDGAVNGINNTYVAWCWKESATAGFDIANFTGNGSARTISHSLSAVPKMIITKNIATTSSWTVYHHKLASDPETDYLYLDTNGAVADWVGHWNDTAPTSSVFTVGTDASTNGDGNTIVAYCFADVQGFSKFGSYVGNGNANGTFVFTGMRPAFVLFKGLASNREWIIADNKRDTYNLVDEVLYANTNDAAGTSAMVDFLSNGFKLRHAAGPGTINTDTETYVYIAFAEAPFVNSNGVPCNAR